MAVSGRGVRGYTVEPPPKFGIRPRELIDRVGELFTYRELLRNLILRDLKTRYKGSALGFLWSFMNPVLMSIIFTVLFTVLLANNSIPNFGLFVLIGILAWNMHSGSIMGGIFGIPASAGLITKVYFPKEVIPIAMVLANSVNFLLAQVVVLAVALLFGVPVTWALLAFPIIFVIQVAFTIGFAMLLGAINVFFRDTAQIMDTLLLAWFFMTPIFYQTADLVPDYARILFILNPVATVITAYREILLNGLFPDPLFLGRAALQAAVVLAIGAFVYTRLSGRFAEEL